MSDRSAGLRRRDGGFTLIEILVVIVTMAVVSTVIAATATVILRTSGPTATRADDSRTLHGLNTWLAQDTSSTAPNDFSIPGTGNHCSGALLGTSLVDMTWIEDTGTPVKYVANYRHVATGGGSFRIDRVTCSGPGAGPFGNTTVLRLSGSLPSTLPTVTPVVRGGQTVGVTMQITTQQGESIFVDGDTRDPDQTLPATTTTTTTVPPTTTTTSTTTTTTTTTLPPVPCDLVGSPTAEIAFASSPVTRRPGGGARELTVDVTVTVQTIGGTTCTNLRLHYNRGHGGAQAEAFISTGPNTWQVVLEATVDNSQRWTSGLKPMNVFDGALGPLNEGLYELQVN